MRHPNAFAASLALTAALTPALTGAQTSFPRPVPSTPKQAVPAAPAPQPAATRRRNRAQQGPTIAADRTMTFRYDDPHATAVLVNVEGMAKPVPLSKGNDGVWTATTGPMDPEEYEYRFQVDGAERMDPTNPHVRTSFFSVSNVALVPGSAPMPWELQAIPHGTVTHHRYQSKLLGDQRDLFVYTPPGYDAKRKTAYPVLYLLHGYSDDASAWIEKGRANNILDSLIAEGKLQPLVVAMPLAYGTMDMINSGWNVWSSPYETPLRNQALLTDGLLHEVLPMVESAYTVARDPAHRAIAGLSMGGGESITTGLNHPEVFGYVGAFSSAIVSPLADDHAAPGTVDAATYGRAFSGIVPNASTQPSTRLFWLSCGSDDGLSTVNRAFGSWAKANVKGTVIAGETPGLHTWTVWRQNLISFMPLLWRNTE